MLNPMPESVGFQREPATLRVAGSLWNLVYPLQILLLKKTTNSKRFKKYAKSG
jgi:hypothetical protein